MSNEGLTHTAAVCLITDLRHRVAVCLMRSEILSASRMRKAFVLISPFVRIGKGFTEQWKWERRLQLLQN